MLNAYRAIQAEAEHPGKKGSMADENQAGLKNGGMRAKISIDNLKITATAMSASPTISVSPTTLSDFTYEFGNGPSTAQSFTVTGSNLTGDLTVSAPTDYRVASSSSGTYGTSLTLTHSGGSVSADVYVKLASGLAIGEYNAQDITISGGGATAQTVTCSGSVTSPPPPEAPVATFATSVDDNSFTATWNSVDEATGYRLDVYTMAAGGGATDLFISEYIEGSSNNKAIEIYNGTGADVDLSNYSVRLYANGAATATNTQNLSGSLADGEVYVIANSSANVTIQSIANITSPVANFNGDDALELYRINPGIQIDIFGMIGQDPGTQWTADGGYSTLDKTLVRKSSIGEGVSVNPSGYSANDTSAFETLGSEWDVYSVDTFDDLGSHTFAGGGAIEFVTGYEDLSVSGTSQVVSGLSQGSTYYYVVRAINAYGTSDNSNEIEVTTTTASPLITLSTETLSGFSYVQGNGPSAAESFTVSGANLTHNITLSAPTNYEISTSSESDYTSSITLTPDSGTVSSTTIYVRLIAGLDVGTHNQIITVSSTGTADQSVTCSGMVHKSVPSYHVSDFTVDTGTLSWSAIDMIWWDPTSGTIPDAYLIKGSTIGYGDISAPVNGVPEANSALVQNVGAGVENHSFAELLAETTYYFKIFPYTNSGEFIQYKTDGVVPEESATTGSEPITLAYWNFNNPPTSGNWPQPIASDPGTGAITYSFANAVSFGGTTVNGTDAEVNGGSFVPQGGTDLGGGVFANNGKYFEIAASTEGFENIVLSYATQRTSTGFSSQAIYYSTDGVNYTLKETNTDIPSSWGIITFDFSEIEGASNNPSFRIKVLLDGASNATGNNRFDNIRLSGYAPAYDIDPDTPTMVGDSEITIVGPSFMGAFVGAPVTSVPNAAFLPTSEGVLTLVGSGLIDITFDFDPAVDWFIYWIGAVQTVIEGPLATYTIVGINLDAKDASLEYKAGTGGDPTLPVELSSFTVSLNAANNAVLSWVTQTETGVSGFQVYRNVEDDLATALLISDLIPATNSSSEHKYNFTDAELFEHGTYYYWLQVSDIDGSEGYYGPTTLEYTADSDPETPSIVPVTRLKSIFPNPFNPSTTLSYYLADEAAVRVQIFNSRGQMVRSLDRGTQGLGDYSIVWDGMDEKGQSQPTGVYFFRLQAGNKVFNSKAVLMK